jgi:hypothetical protein
MGTKLAMIYDLFAHKIAALAIGGFAQRHIDEEPVREQGRWTMENISSKE